jgi:hypothetical protein
MFTISTRRTLVALAVLGGLAVGCDQTSPTPPPPPPPAPLSVTAVFPNTGSTFGATTVTIAGTGFQAGASVTIDGIAATVTTLGRTAIGVRMPPHTPGPIDVVVVNPAGERASAPGGFTYVVSPLWVFREPDSGFSTSDLHDGQGRILQVNTAGHLIFLAEAIGLPGHSVTGGNFGETFIPVEALCSCWLEVRFGTKDGERRAYLTAEYGQGHGVNRARSSTSGSQAARWS